MIPIIDLHCDTLLECYLRGEKLRDREGGHLNLEKLRGTGLIAQCFACFLPMGEEAVSYGVTLKPYELFLEMYALYESELQANEDLILPACSVADIAENQRKGKLSALLTIEDAELLENQIERVDELAGKGVSMMSLIWNFENCLGFPNHIAEEQHDLGLKPFGIEAVERMNEVGIIVDVSHLSEGGFYDVVKYGKKPFAASHSCARALCDHKRNLTDDQLHQIGETGSVVGVNFNAPFIELGSKRTETDSIVRHLAYMADKAGIEAVALGSDFDGIGCELELLDCTGFDQLIARMGSHFSDDEIEKICSGNFLRLLEECGKR